MPNSNLLNRTESLRMLIKGGLAVYLKLNGVEFCCTGQEKWSELVDRLPEGGEGALGISIAGRTCSLNEQVEEYVYARVLTCRDDEGHRIYERTLQFVFLTAVHRLYPGERVRIRHSLINGFFIDMPGVMVNDRVAAAIKSEMLNIISADLPIEKRQVSLEEAKAYFTRTGQTDRLLILKYRKVPHFTLYRIDDLDDYFYGEMAVSTGAIRGFDLLALEGCLLLQRPDWVNPDRPAPFRQSPHLLDTYTRAAEWHAILRCENVPDLNDMVRHRGLREFIRVNEALQERRIEQIAEDFIRSKARLLLIAGPSSSGKTTFSHRLSIALRVHGLRPVKISLDDYYIDRDKLPLEPDGSVDLETIDALDVSLLCEHLPRLLNGERVELPLYDFLISARSEKTHPVQVPAGQPIIIEGIHGLNDRLTATVSRDMKFKVYISPLTMLNLDDHNRIGTTDARLLRRIVRDHQFRGTSPEETMDMWPSVRRGEEKYIFPFQEQADAMFNSALTYELAIMKKYAYPSLLAIPPESPNYTLARRLVKFLNYIESADVEDEIPLNSILREFIGGCTFYREED